MQSIDKDMSDKTHEQMLLLMNERLLQSKAAMLFVENPDGSVEFIRSTKTLNFVEYIGLLSWVKTKMIHFLDGEIPRENLR
jgi:hypothetical protein